MNSVLITVLLNVLKQLPSIVTEVEAAIKTAESPEAGSQKAKDLISDVVKLLGIIGEAL